jgi:hypothetical protein
MFLVELKRRRMKTHLSLPLLLVFLLFIFATNAFSGPFEGPLVIKNGYPLYAALGSPSLLSAEPENSLDINFSYSSTYSVKNVDDWYFGIDLETAVTDFQFKRLVGKETEIGLDVPIIRYGPGFMDGAIQSFHDLIGLRNAYNRKDRPRDQFLLQVTHNGEIVIQGKPGRTALGDIMVEVKQLLYDDLAATMISIQAFLNVPTGDADSAFGSGRTNGGMALLINEKLGNDVMLYFNTGIGLIDKLEAMQKIKLRNYFYGGLGFEWLYSRSISLDAQLMIQTSPFPKSGVKFIDYPSMLGSLGGRYKVDALSSLGIAVTEDPDTAGAPDIMIGADYRYHF